MLQASTRSQPRAHTHIQEIKRVDIANIASRTHRGTSNWTACKHFPWTQRKNARLTCGFGERVCLECSLVSCDANRSHGETGESRRMAFKTFLLFLRLHVTSFTLPLFHSPSLSLSLSLSPSFSLSLSLSLSVSTHRYTLLRHSKERQGLDGLNNLHYSPLVSRRPLYTNVSVSLSRQLAQIADY